MTESEAADMLAAQLRKELGRGATIEMVVAHLIDRRCVLPEFARAYALREYFREQWKAQIGKKNFMTVVRECAVHFDLSVGYCYRQCSRVVRGK